MTSLETLDKNSNKIFTELLNNNYKGSFSGFLEMLNITENEFNEVSRIVLDQIGFDMMTFFEDGK